MVTFYWHIYIRIYLIRNSLDIIIIRITNRVVIYKRNSIDVLNVWLFPKAIYAWTQKIQNSHLFKQQKSLIGYLFYSTRLLIFSLEFYICINDAPVVPS